MTLRSLVVIVVLAVICCVGPDAAQPHETSEVAPSAFTLSPPEQDEPIEVLFDFQLYDIIGIDGVAETFELNGAMTLTWRDPREAFDPAVAGVNTKSFQGDYQVNEVATGWYPQVVLLNEAGAYSRSGVQLRIKPDGTSVLKEKITAVVEADLNMRSFPFDAHRLEAVFALLGHDSGEVVLRVEPQTDDSTGGISIPGWTLRGVRLSLPAQQADTAAKVAMRSGAAILTIEVARGAGYIRRLITFPMVVIVLLSFSIFWMDKSSLGDRNSISFIGVLTGVAFQHMVVDVIPPVAYITLMHAFLFISFLVMAATVPVNLVVAALDRKGRSDLGDLIDRRCRWLFPLTYFLLIAVLVIRVLV